MDNLVFNLLAESQGITSLTEDEMSLLVQSLCMEHRLSTPDLYIYSRQINDRTLILLNCPDGSTLCEFSSDYCLPLPVLHP